MVKINPEAFFLPSNAKTKQKPNLSLVGKNILREGTVLFVKIDCMKKIKHLSPASTIIAVKFRALSKIALKYNTKQKQKSTHVALRCFSHVMTS